jgi:hypothetical protein
VCLRGTCDFASFCVGERCGCAYVCVGAISCVCVRAPVEGVSDARDFRQRTAKGDAASAEARESLLSAHAATGGEEEDDDVGYDPARSRSRAVEVDDFTAAAGTSDTHHNGCVICVSSYHRLLRT